VATLLDYTAIPFHRVSYYISFRDVQFTPSDKGVRIVVVTDIYCHIYCRLTPYDPRIHKKAVIRRGIPIMDDVRFCFTVFEDNEQFEPGDTLIHTFWKPNWPVCTTKFCYFWGYVSGYLANSTSCFLEYHNNGVNPVPTPDLMYNINEIDPEYRLLTPSTLWLTHDLSYESFSEDATGVILMARHTTIANKYMGFRPFGSTANLGGIHSAYSIHFIPVKLSADKKIECALELGATGYYKVIAYCGRNFHWLDPPLDVTPFAPNDYRFINAWETMPGAKLVFMVMRQDTQWVTSVSVRPNFSTKEIYKDNFTVYPITGVNDLGQFEVKLSNLDHNQKVYVVGYLTQDVTISQNGTPVSPALTASSWNDRTLPLYYAPARFAVLEMAHLTSETKIGARKRQGGIMDYDNMIRHTWVITHLDKDRAADIYTNKASTICYWLAGIN
jgi:hypothetical protein